jgi:outer membrane protein OmpA-like peptidoglycan-associated protein
MTPHGPGRQRRKHRVDPSRARAIRRSIAPAAAVLLVLAVTAAGATGTGDAAVGQGAPAKTRTRGLVARVRDLDYRWRALDGSERVEESGERTTVTFSADLLFEFDRADLTPAAGTRLGQLADQLSGLGPRAVTIAGHSDGRGDPAYNQDLSVRRAHAVEAPLAGRLGAGFRFEVAGYGETRPVASNEKSDGSDDPDGRALNRRVEISFPNR